MNSLYLRAAVAGALAFAALPALAIDNASAVTSYTAATALPFGGATATDRTFGDLFLDKTNGLCQDDQANASLANASAAGSALTEVFQTAAGNYNNANFAIMCRARAAAVPGGAAIPAGLLNQFILVGKYSGGSDTGIIPVQAQTPLGTVGSASFPDVAACRAAVTPVIVNDGVNVAYARYSGCASVAAPGVVPKAGFSDVEARLFFTDPNLGPAVFLNESGMTVATGADVGFAPIVNRKFFVALQTAQGITAAACGESVDTAGTLGLTGRPTLVTAANAATCMPSLSLAQLRGYFTGLISDTTSLLTSTGAAFPAAASGDANVYIARRGDSSGTQKAYETYYTAQGCADPALANAKFVTSGLGTTANGGTGAIYGGQGWSESAVLSTQRVFEGTGTGDVRNSLISRDNYVEANLPGGSQAAYFAQLTAAEQTTATASIWQAGGDRYAIGIVSSENVQPAGSFLPQTGPGTANTGKPSPGWNYIAVDGTLPTLENTVRGKYQHYTSNRIYGVAGLTGVPSNILTYTTTAIRLPAVLRRANVDHGWGHGGLLTRPNSTAATNPTMPVTSASVDASPRNSSVKATGANAAANNCVPPLTVKPVSIQ